MDGLQTALNGKQAASTALGYVDVAVGNYGTIKVDDDRGVAWAGYAIRDDWVFMSSGADAAEMAEAIRATVADLAGAEYAESVPVLYGGSVTADSFEEFIAEPSIDGALIGGASLKPDQMSGIAAAAAEAAATRAA